MRRLVIALTTLLTLVGVSVVAGYLFVFGPTVDKAATMAPANALAYVTVYLSPSTGQETSLADLLTRLPGFWGTRSTSSSSRRSRAPAWTITPT